jgi:hypothetical protein
VEGGVEGVSCTHTITATPSPSFNYYLHVNSHDICNSIQDWPETQTHVTGSTSMAQKMSQNERLPAASFSSSLSRLSEWHCYPQLPTPSLSRPQSQSIPDSWVFPHLFTIHTLIQAAVMFQTKTASSLVFVPPE